ncbi:hypothetical protein Cgig2_027301 [Carnegiea gigantea]|uniref:Myb/SANT-like domain-containing protein n=1 Tax=Carnegiea gigantea TaxID=171969 RepID=A0A9Q1JW17_9CARY|nr:hypothetical protein Cgig2_027301 [Carnegiea gigantea]
MEKGKMKELKTQFWWSIPLSKELVTFLANEVQMGNRPNNSFKFSSHVAPANAILKKFNVNCLPIHINNHLKIVNNAWAIISKLRDKESSFRWDDNLKMITASATVYKTYTEVYNALQCLCFSWSSHLRLATALHTLSSNSCFSHSLGVNPTHEKYLNKKIHTYDEIAFVVGKDVTRGNGDKSTSHFMMFRYTNIEYNKFGRERRC